MMFAFDCGSSPDRRGDAIATVRHHDDGTFQVTRAWIIDVEKQRFVSVLPERVACESPEGHDGERARYRESSGSAKTLTRAR